MSSNSSSWVFVWIPHKLATTPAVIAWVQEKVTDGVNLLIYIGYNLLIGPSDFSEHHAFSAHNHILREIELKPGSGMLRVHTQEPEIDPAMTIQKILGAKDFNRIYICTTTDDTPALIHRTITPNEKMAIVGF
jgi:hypothetical protein